jgi:glycosyltransferase involved in cell wall biosynthesis
MRLAFFSPLPPARSGIADYSAMLLSVLAAEAEITAFVAPDARPAEGLPPDITCAQVSDFHPYDFDIALYQMGNSIHHTYIYHMLLQHPGITVLHEPYLHHFISHITIGQGDRGAYVREMGYAYGAAGMALARAINAGQVELPLHTLPLAERIVDSSLGIITHSRYASQIVMRSRPDAPLAVIAQPMRTRHVAELNIPSDALLIVIVGQATQEKQIPSTLRALARLQGQQLEAHLLLVGEIPPWYRAVDETIWQLGLEAVVHRTGYLTDLADFESWIAAADLCVNLRAPSLGETSAGLLRIMALGKPALVCDTGWYAELPPEVVRHVRLTAAGEVDQDDLTAAIFELASDAAERQRMGEQARTYVSQYHRPEESAQSYLDFVHSILGAS